MGVIFLQAIMETILAFFNHFPLFAIMLRIKDPHRLPGGLQFEIFQQDEFLLEHHGILHRVKQIWHKFRLTNTYTNAAVTIDNNNNKLMSSASTSNKFKRKKQRSVSFAIPDAANTTAPKKKPHRAITTTTETTASNSHTKKKAASKRGAYLWMRVSQSNN